MYSSELRGYLTGLILGDGFIGSGTNARSFSIKSINYDFIKKIESDLNSCSNFKISIRNIPENYSCNTHYKEAWELYVKSHPYFNKRYHYFYDDYKRRIITSESLKWLTANGLANWYMCDGYVCHVGKNSGKITNRRIDICTDRYKKDDVEKIKNCLLNKFNIECSIIKRNNKYRIRILQNSYDTFIELIYPYVIPSFRYKLYLGYNNKPYWMKDNVWNIQKEIVECNHLYNNKG